MASASIQRARKGHHFSCYWLTRVLLLLACGWYIFLVRTSVVIQATETTASLPVHHRTTDVNKRPELLFIAVASMQRSSSSQLANSILTKHPCAITLNEILHIWQDEKHVREALEIAGDVLHSKEAKDITGQEWVEFIRRVGFHHCGCQRCIVAWKEFYNIHVPLQVHEYILRNFSNVTIILERRIEDRWKSSWVAYETGDWDVFGSAVHQRNKESVYVPPMSSTLNEEICRSKTRSNLCDFKRKHEEWYKFLRSNLRNTVEVSFQEVTTNVTQIQQKIASAVPKEFQSMIFSTKG